MMTTTTRAMESITIPMISPMLSPPVSSIGLLSVVTFAVVVVALKHHEK